MTLFDGLHLYEIVLLVLGVMLFFVLVVILIIFAIQRRGITAVLPFFIASVLMIAFPAICDCVRGAITRISTQLSGCYLRRRIFRRYIDFMISDFA